MKPFLLLLLSAIITQPTFANVITLKSGASTIINAWVETEVSCENSTELPDCLIIEDGNATRDGDYIYSRTYLKVISKDKPLPLQKFTANWNYFSPFKEVSNPPPNVFLNETAAKLDALNKLLPIRAMLQAKGVCK